MEKEINEFIESHKGNVKFLYMMLSRLESDCEFYLDCGNRNNKYLWASDVHLHVAYMKAIYKALPVTPEWLTMAQIKEYENKMLNE